ncbi:GUN4 domain-containing protein [Aetokthonos hydrillicola Thurmond2011]|jgi:predicted NACHT family NTPase|uniref:GUN4 domain-containing protein n=1 Tax=Aetokthonos hydrillicola Thurmond2011 TaxID=2712845 RepID=A0AAP5IH76_9CYAN|nr:GUN4 domain-containing protein [Aetokthonos hydrillicola]MBW4591295.1 GUN4 domain-containing protein [Aetokthonos hydrillicola CCALA 1050]MDR9900507.1 GUN4 domain-containing protein [Aetokthonos hydrillicola Thurmond2011]
MMPTPQQRKKLQDALISAFPERVLLEQLLDYELDRKLNQITQDSNLQTVVYQLIQRAQAEGWLIDLVEAAHKENPGNSELTVIAFELLLIQDKYYEWLIGKCQNYETEGLNSLGSLSLPDVFVPLKIAANYQDNARSEMIPLKDYHVNSPKTIWDFLIAAIGDNRLLNQSSIVILGAPGSGKTTLLKHLAYIYAKKEQKFEKVIDLISIQKEKVIELIPVFFLIREVYKEIVNKQPHLVDFIAEQVKLEIESQLLSAWFGDKLREGKCLIILDGLDEVADENERSVVRNWIDQQIDSFRENAFILTSRPRGYKEASLKKAGIVLEVQPFQIEQVRDFIHKWYLATEKIRLVGDSIPTIEEQAKEQAEDLITRIRNSSPLAAMAVNPLLLTMISIVHHQLSLKNSKLPERRVDLYKEMCEVLLEKRQKEKNISDKLTGKNKQSVLQVLALKLMQQTNSEQQTATEFKMSQGISWIQEPLAARVSDEIEPKQFIEYIRDVSGLLVEKELQYYQFAHLSFQEYLAATQISELNQENLLISNITKSWWSETIRLYAAQSDATELIREVSKIQSPSADMLALAYDCLEESLRVDKDVRRELLQRLEDGLESTDPEIFKLAVQVRLIRRFRSFVRINEEIEIDNSYITYAEYQLFLDETGESRQPQNWQRKRFSPGDAKKTIIGISWENALRFCTWLGQWYRTRLGNQLSEMAVHYRLPEKEEINRYSINDDRICLVKFQLPSRYSKLADCLWSGEWKKADEETANLMLQVSKRENQGYLNVKDIENFPCDDLGRIDFLWVYASKGHFGFSVQKNIYQSLGGTSEYNERVWRNYGGRLGWRVKESWIYYTDVIFDTTAPGGHLPILYGTVGSLCHVSSDRYTLLGIVGMTQDKSERMWLDVARLVSSLASRLVNCNI